MLSGRILQFQQREGDAVDHDEHVRAAVLAILDDRELVDSHPVVVRRLLEVHQPQACGPQLAIIVTVFNGHAVGDELMQTSVLVDGALRLSPLNHLHCFINQ